MVIRKGDFYFSITLLVLCGFVFFESFTFSAEASIFPRISSSVLFVLGGILLISSCKGTQPRSDAEGRKGFKYINAVFLVAGFVVYALVLRILGYIMSTAVLVYYTIFVMGYRNQKWIVATTVLSVSLTYVVFRLLLGVPLPVSFVSRIIEGL